MLNVPLNIPNLLSLYRLLSFPFVLYLGLYGYETLFVWLLVINLITDVLDGLIARLFKLQTEIGAKLDSIADAGTYILAIVGIFKFRYSDMEPYFGTFFIFIGLFIASHILFLIRFKRMPSFHLYSWKICGYIQGIWFFTLFVFAFWEPFYWVMVLTGIAAFIEHIVIQLIIRKPSSNLKGLYWVLRNRKE